MRSLISIICSVMTSMAVQAAIREKNSLTYARDIEKFKLSLNLPLVDHVVELTLPNDQIAIRLKATDNSIVEPLQIIVPRDRARLTKSIEELCSKNCQLFTKKIREKINADTTGEKVVSISLTQDLFSQLNREKYLGLLRKKHHHIMIKTEDLTIQQKFEMLRQMHLFLNPQEVASLKTHLAKTADLSVDRYLLPKFATNVVTHFTKYKGPNCFHAALAFQNLSLAKSPTVNIHEELGYHPAMINYDELWRVLQSNFYEINPEKTQLEYGDMVVIMDLANDRFSKPVDYKSIRHAATYLFNGFVFSKGSKSASSPYLIKPLSDEFKLWKSFTPHIAVKVFRNNSTKQSTELKFLDDWLDQT